MADIQFTGEIVLDTKAAQKGISELSRQIQGVYSQVSALMSKSLQSHNFGFSNIPSFDDAVAETNKLIGKEIAKAKKLPQKTAQQKAYKASVIDQILAARGALGAIDDAGAIMARLSSNDTIFGDIDKLKKDVEQGTLNSKTALGRYNVLQRYAGGVLNVLYAARRKHPSLISEAALEYAESARDRNRKTGAGSRSEERYLFEKAYRENAAATAVDFMLDTDSRLSAISSEYGVSFTRTKKRLPENINQKYIDNMTAFLDTMDSIADRKRKLDSGDLSKAQRTNEFKYLQKDLTELARVGRALGGEAKKASLAIKESNDLYITEKKGQFANEFWRNLGGTALIANALSAGTEMLRSYWGESITRSVYGSKAAYYKRWETGGQAAGTVGGTALGLLAAGPIGAAVGAVLGNILGPLYGQYKQIKLESDIKSTSEMMDRIRNMAVYGSGYNTYYATAMEQVTGGNGMAELASNAMDLRARMMLGQVGEMDMLYYSMMPNYYAALMSGMTGPRLAQIYKRDLAAIGDPSMRYHVGRAIGGENAFAMANNPYFNMISGTVMDNASKYENNARMLMTGYAMARAGVAREDIEKNFNELLNTANRKDTTFYSTGKEYSWLEKVAGDPIGQLVMGMMGISPHLVNQFNKSIATDSKGNITLVVPVYLPDGTEISRTTKTAEELYTDSWAQFAGA